MGSPTPKSSSSLGSNSLDAFEAEIAVPVHNLVPEIILISSDDEETVLTPKSIVNGLKDEETPVQKDGDGCSSFIMLCSPKLVSDKAVGSSSIVESTPNKAKRVLDFRIFIAPTMSKRRRPKKMNISKMQKKVGADGEVKISN